MALQALLLTRDQEVNRTLRRVLETNKIEVSVCADPQQARLAISRQKYDAVVVDCDDIKEGPAVLKELRQGKSNKSCITFAVVHGRTTVQQAFELGANFVLDKPLALDRVTRSIRAAQGLIMRERRRYHRHLLRATGSIVVDSGTELPVRITNISQGGISIECSRQLDEGGAARLRFVLPGAKRAMEVKGEVMWANLEGQAGIRFQILSLDVKQELDKWLDRHALPLGNGAMFINAAL